jgi:hypothetical protein
MGGRRRKDGKLCQNKTRVRRDVAERVIFGALDAMLLDPVLVKEIGERDAAGAKRAAASQAARQRSDR